MKKLCAFAMACVIMLIAAGCGFGAGDAEERAVESTRVGRFTEMSVSFEKDSGSVSSAFMKDDNLVFYTSALGFGESGEMESAVFRNVLSGEEISRKRLEQYDKLFADPEADLFYIQSICEGWDGSLAILFTDNMYNSRVYRSVNNGDFTEIIVDELKENAEGTRNPLGIIVLNDSFFIQFPNSVRQYDYSGAALAQYECGDAPVMASVYGSRIALLSYEQNKVEIHNIAARSLEHSISIQDVTHDVNTTVIGLDAGGLYLGSSQGIFRYDENGWVMIVDGGLTSLIMPDKSFQLLISDEKGEFYAFLGAYSEVARFYYDKDLKMPDTFLDIFGLHNNNTIRKAIGEFQVKNPSVRVNYRVALDEELGASAQDVIRALNTEILAGNGPDVLVLDGLPVESYIEKGVLADISGLASEYTTKHGLSRAMSKAYERNGKVYGLPSRFTLPIMVGQKSQIEQIDSLETLARMVERLQGGDVPLLFAPETLHTSEYGVYMEYYDSSESAFFNGEAIDEAALAEFYENMRVIHNVLDEHTPEYSFPGRITASTSGGSGSESISNGAVAIMLGNVQAHLQKIVGVMSLYYFEFFFGANPDIALMSMFNHNQYMPVAGVGIVTNGGKTELAEAFVETLMSAGIQDAYLYDGFPVREASLLSMFEELADGMYPDGTVPKFMGFAELYGNLSTAVFTDEAVKNAVQSKIPAIIGGSLEPEGAAEQVVRDTRLYLAE